MMGSFSLPQIPALQVYSTVCEALHLEKKEETLHFLLTSIIHE